LTGTGADVGSKVELYYKDGTKIKTKVLTTQDMSNGYIDIPTNTLADGTTHTFKVNIIDKAGNKGAFSADHTFTIDTTSPNAPTDLKLLTTDDTGRSSIDNITYKTSVTITGKAEAGSSVELFDGSRSLGKTTTDSDGNFSKVVTLPANTIEKASITAKATDSAGNPPSPASTALLVTVDNLSPDAPTDLKLLTTDDTGSSSTDNITNKTRVTITGKAEANSFVELLNHDTSLGTVTTDSDGNFRKVVTLQANETIANIITAKATDIAGNPPSPASTPLSVIVDTTPNPPTDLKLFAADDTGASNADNITKKTTVTITGKADANLFVELFNNGISLGIITADNRGNFSKLVDLVPNIETSITAKVTDIAGNTSPSAELKITVD
ncbi:MAG: hypothetical protein FE834_05510, partial [Gammaproteobacteria bacterium]|nr:hypothetical protein [Gammaproteobacteria bacterium]